MKAVSLVQIITCWGFLSVMVLSCTGPADTTSHSERQKLRAEAEQHNTEMARQANELLVKLDQAPRSSALQQELLQLFGKLSLSEAWVTSPPLEKTVINVLLKANQYAQSGHKDFLKALMKSSRGSYGQSAHGGEWINELLWMNLTVQPQLTIDVLYELPPASRKTLIESEYLHPIHERFDFAKILAGLKKVAVPKELQRDVERIKKVVQASLAHEMLGP